MTIYCQSAEISDFSVVSGSVSYSTTAGTYTSANARGSTLIAQAAEDTNYIELPTFSSNEFWFHTKLYLSIISQTPKRLIKFYSGGTARLALIQSAASSGIWRVQKFNGSWSSLGDGSASGIVASTLMDVDVYVKLGNPGTVSIYKDGVPVFSDSTLDLTWSGVTDFDIIRLQSQATAGGGTSTYFSENIVADWNTIGSKLVTRAPDAAGNYTDWTGAYTAVDEYSPTADFITSGTANQRFTALCSDFPSLVSGETIESVQVTAWAMRDASGPQNLNLFLRVAGSDYDGSDQSLTVGLASKREVWALDPSDSGAWTVSDLNSMEIGVRSRA